MRIKAVLFDLIGTTVIEREPDTLATCFELVFQSRGLNFERDWFASNRGLNKIDFIRMILRKNRAPVYLAPILHKAFKHELSSRLDNFNAAVSAKEIFQFLKKNHVIIGIGTGLERDVFEQIAAAVGWQNQQFDYSITASEVHRSRPHPDMINDMIARFNIALRNTVMKVGDTVNDIREGKNAGVITTAVRGTEPEEKLRAEQPDHIVSSLLELKELVKAEKQQEI